MSKFGPEQRARIFAESRRLLADEPASHKEPPTPEPPLTIETQEARWRREAEDFERQRAAAKAAMRREEREGREAMMQARALGADAAARLAALEARMDEAERQISELSRAVGDFSDAVNGGFSNLDKQLAQLGTKLTEIRAADDVNRAADFPRLVRRTN
jgi:chromosome segregation ATPase